MHAESVIIKNENFHRKCMKTYYSYNFHMNILETNELPPDYSRYRLQEIPNIRRIWQTNPVRQLAFYRRHSPSYRNVINSSPGFDITLDVGGYVGQNEISLGLPSNVVRGLNIPTKKHIKKWKKYKIKMWNSLQLVAILNRVPNDVIKYIMLPNFRKMYPRTIPPSWFTPEWIRDYNIRETKKMTKRVKWRKRRRGYIA